MKYEITVPLPPKALSPNARVHWAVKAKVTKQYRAACAMAYHCSRVPPLFPPVKIHLDFYLARVPLAYDAYFAKDADNARSSFKAGQDALADAGIIPSDGQRYLRMGETRLHTRAKEHQGRCCVVVTLEEVEND
jgi:crossover junction endodeoxyribonuclease RusA